MREKISRFSFIGWLVVLAFSAYYREWLTFGLACFVLGAASAWLLDDMCNAGQKNET